MDHLRHAHGGGAGRLDRDDDLPHCRAPSWPSFYKLPCHTTAPNSDNHAHDEQNAWEKTLSQFCAVAAGNDLIVNCGMFATGMTCSHEQLLMDEEISAMSRRIADGMAVNAETIAADLIKQIGPRGEGYLTAEHTLRWLRSKEYLQPRLSVRGNRAAWEAQGAKDTYQLAREKVRQLGPTACPQAAAAPDASPARRDHRSVLRMVASPGTDRRLVGRGQGEGVTADRATQLKAD